MNPLPAGFDVSREIAEAIAQRAPVVALESTIVSHGMPYPENVETALAVERDVRGNGGVPATIAVIGGRVKIGLSESDLERIARGSDVMKLSRFDLPQAIATGRDGATTVAATMLLAHRAQIRVFATGGIGGVHRGAEESLDISADLYELARTPMAVVCAGAKALLDLRKTLEVLETLGVPVIAYRSDDFPAFWSRSSGLPAPLRCDTPQLIAAFIRAQRELQLGAGTVIANPIEAAAEIPRSEMERHIGTAVGEARQAGVAGKALTPWLLERIAVLTSGRSLAANIALVRSNARLAAEVCQLLT